MSLKKKISVPLLVLSITLYPMQANAFVPFLIAAYATVISGIEGSTATVVSSVVIASSSVEGATAAAISTATVAGGIYAKRERIRQVYNFVAVTTVEELDPTGLVSTVDPKHLVKGLVRPNHHSKDKDKRKEKKNPMSLNEAVRISNLGRIRNVTVPNVRVFTSPSESIVKDVNIRVMVSKICNVTSADNRLLMSEGKSPISHKSGYDASLKKAYRQGLIDYDTKEMYLKKDSGLKCELHHLNQVEVLTGEGIYALMPMALHRGKGMYKHVHKDGLSGSGGGISTLERLTHSQSSNQAKILKAIAATY